MACQVKLPARYNGYWLKENDDRPEKAVKEKRFFFTRVSAYPAMTQTILSAPAHLPLLFTIPSH